MIYLVILAQMLLFGESRMIAREIFNENRQQFINVVPLNSIKKYINNYEYFRFQDWMNNIVGNILIFVPVGIAVTAIFRSTRNFFIGLAMGILMSGTIELIQLKYNLGVFDVDDIMLNVFGYIIGFLVFAIAYIPFKRKYYSSKK